jgi:serine/threonine protein kinase
VRNPTGKTTSTLTQLGTVLGSSEWMAPEQHDAAHEATPSTDVYSAGAIVSWLLSGVTPRPDGVQLPEVSSNLRPVAWKRRDLGLFQSRW